MAPITIVGAGLAGYGVARALRRLSAEVPIRIIAADAAHVYSKPALSNAFAAKKPAEALVLKSADAIARELRMDVVGGVRVEEFDRARRVVRAEGREWAYGKLVLALGSDPVAGGLEGRSDIVHTMNDIHDYERFRARIEAGGSVAVLGAGMIGCELANDLRLAGRDVMVVDPAELPLLRLMPRSAGEHLRSALEAIGIRFAFGQMPTRLDEVSGRIRVTCASGEALVADHVLSAVGLRPRTALAAAAGLGVGRGILVNRYLRTTDDDIYALGDCAEVEGLVLPFVAPLLNAARALAATLAGTPTPVVYPPMPVVVKTPACPLVVSPPPAGAEGRWDVQRLDAGFRGLFFLPNGKLSGFVLMGEVVKESQRLAKELPPVLA